MKKDFDGIWASFEYLDDSVKTIEALQNKGCDYTVLSPCPRHELFEAAQSKASRLPFVTLIFGAIGLFFGYAIPSWTALDWVLPVSAKPIVSIPTFTVIGFELMILLGGLSTATGLLIMGYRANSKKVLPQSDEYRNYSGFSEDKFGIVVRCDKSEVEDIEKLMNDNHANAIFKEFSK